MATSMQIKKADREVKAFNDANEVGCGVGYWTGVRQGDPKFGTTRSPAFVTAGGQAVVFVTGHSAFIALSHVETAKRRCECCVYGGLHTGSASCPKSCSCHD